MLMSSLVTIFLLACFVQVRYDGFHFILYNFVIFCCYLLEACTFIMRDRNGRESGGGELGE